MSLLDRISIDPEVRFAKPCISWHSNHGRRPARLPCRGMSEDQILSDFPAADARRRHSMSRIRCGTRATDGLGSGRLTCAPALRRTVVRRADSPAVRTWAVGTVCEPGKAQTAWSWTSPTRNMPIAQILDRASGDRSRRRAFLRLVTLLTTQRISNRARSSRRSVSSLGETGPTWISRAREAAGEDMNLHDLESTPSWEWPDDARNLLLATLRDERAAATDRHLAWW